MSIGTRVSEFRHVSFAADSWSPVLQSEYYTL